MKIMLQIPKDEIFLNSKLREDPDSRGIVVVEVRQELIAILFLISIPYLLNLYCSN